MPQPLRTAIFGGSFNPIHNGHIALARQLIHEDKTDEVWMLVSPQNPMKRQAGLKDEAIRLALAQEAVKGEKGIRVSDFEFHLPRPSYTWNTLQALSKAYPGRRFSLLIGADNWQIFGHWAHYEEILENHTLFVYPRQGFPIDRDNLPPGVHPLEAPLFPFSSTDIRKAVVEGRSIRDMIPASIIERVLNIYRI